VVPVVAATATQGSLPVYLRGIGNVTPAETVTLHSRVDGQIVSVDFTEGQFVHKDDLLVEIDPRPYEAALAQAQGQLAHDTALYNDDQATRSSPIGALAAANHRLSVNRLLDDWWRCLAEAGP
jgi:multidrug efflux system membrane fusion protein